MDPQLIDQASRYLGALLGQPAEQLQQLATNLLTSQILQWQGANSFSVNRDDLRLLSVAPALLSDTALARANSSASRHETERRLHADPIVREQLSLDAAEAGDMFGMSVQDRLALAARVDAALGAPGAENLSPQERYRAFVGQRKQSNITLLRNANGGFNPTGDAA